MLLSIIILMEVIYVFIMFVSFCGKCFLTYIKEQFGKKHAQFQFRKLPIVFVILCSQVWDFVYIYIFFKFSNRYLTQSWAPDFFK